MIFLNPEQSKSFFPHKLVHRDDIVHRHHLYPIQQKSYPDLPIKPDKPCDVHL